MTQSHCLPALIAKRAELAGEIKAQEASLAQSRANLVHLDAVIRMLDPDMAPEEIGPKRIRRIVNHNEWFGQGELPRLVLNALRMAASPMQTRDVARLRLSCASSLVRSLTALGWPRRSRRPACLACYKPCSAELRPW